MADTDQDKPDQGAVAQPENTDAQTAAETAAETAAASARPADAGDAGPAGHGPVLRITQIASGLGRKRNQRDTLVALGLNKLHRSRVIPDTPSMRGRIDRVRHLLKVERIEDGGAAQGTGTDGS